MHDLHARLYIYSRTSSMSTELLHLGHPRLSTFFFALTFLLFSGSAIQQLSAQVTSDPGRVVIVNNLDSTVSILDVSSLNVLKTLRVGVAPYFAAYGSGILAVSVEGEGKINFYDASSYTYKGSINIGEMETEHLLTYKNGERALFGSRSNNEIIVIDLKSMKEIKRIGGISAPHNIQVGPSGRYAYVTSKINAGISIVDLEANTVKAFHSVKVRPRGLTVSPDESRIYFGANWVNGLFEMDAQTGKILRFINIPPPPGCPDLAENTYHGFEFITDEIMLAGLEGHSSIDIVHIPSGKVLSRFYDVDKPSAVLKIPGSKRDFMVACKGSNDVLHLHLNQHNQVEVVKRTNVGHIRGTISKRLTYLP